MSSNKSYHAPFEEDCYFHVYNRTNNRELLFKSDANRLYFLKQYARYIHPFAATCCWCLLPNHFHFLIRIREITVIKKHLEQLTAPLKKEESNFLKNCGTMDELISSQWQRFFTSYAMGFNKQYDRKGNLFHRPFKRRAIDRDAHFTQAVIYIHANPKRHGICSNFMEYKWSSFQGVLSKNETLLNRSELLEWFGGRETFIKVHQEMAAHYYNNSEMNDDETALPIR